VHHAGQISIANIKTQPQAQAPHVATIGHSQFYEYLLGGMQFQIANAHVDWSLLITMVIIQIGSLVYCIGWRHSPKARAVQAS
jgi:hypothetical protein